MHNVFVSCRASLEDRLKLEEQDGLSVADTAVGSKQITFTLKKVLQFNTVEYSKTVRGLSKFRVKIVDRLLNIVHHISLEN